MTNLKYRIWGGVLFLSQLIILYLSIRLPGEDAAIPLQWRILLGIATLCGLAIGICGIVIPRQMKDVKFLHLLLATAAMIVSEALVLAAKFT